MFFTKSINIRAILDSTIFYCSAQEEYSNIIKPSTITITFTGGVALYIVMHPYYIVPAHIITDCYVLQYLTVGFLNQDCLII